MILYYRKKKKEKGQLSKRLRLQFFSFQTLFQFQLPLPPPHHLSCIYIPSLWIIHSVVSPSSAAFSHGGSVLLLLETHFVFFLFINTIITTILPLLASSIARDPSPSLPRLFRLRPPMARRARRPGYPLVHGSSRVPRNGLDPREETTLLAWSFEF